LTQKNRKKTAPVVCRESWPAGTCKKPCFWKKISRGQSIFRECWREKKNNWTVTVSREKGHEDFSRWGREGDGIWRKATMNAGGTAGEHEKRGEYEARETRGILYQKKKTQKKKEASLEKPTATRRKSGTLTTQRRKGMRGQGPLNHVSSGTSKKKNISAKEN